MSIEAMKLAAEFIEQVDYPPYDSKSILAGLRQTIEQAEQAPPLAVYGYCPECGAKGVLRERRPNGNDKCANGHTYPSASAIKTSPPPSQPGVGLTPEERDYIWNTVIPDLIAGALGVSRGTAYDLMRDLVEQINSTTSMSSTSTPPPRQPLTDDTKRLNAIVENSWDLRCFDMPTGQGDADIGWRVIEHHMTKPHERVVAEVFDDDPRKAIDAALKAAHGIKENT